MRGYVLFTASMITVAALTGCNDPARSHLELLANDLAVASATGYTHSDTYSRDEEQIHRRHEESRATNRVLAQFLMDDPPVNDELKALLHYWKKKTATSEALHKMMIDEGRFTYSEGEKHSVEVFTRVEVLVDQELRKYVDGD